MEYSFLKLQARRIPKPSFRFLLVIPVGVAVAAAIWYSSHPMLEELKTKDAHRYELMVHEASHFHFINAWNQWVELKEVSHDQVLLDRHHRLIRRWESDSAFRQEKNKAEEQARRRDRVWRAKDSKSLLGDLRAAPSDRKVRRAYWESASAWEKGLLLREQCVRWLHQEIEDHKNRRNLQGASRLGVLSAGASAFAPSEQCSEWVPVREDERAVPQAIQALKEGMNYYYFVRLLDEIGLAENEAFNFSRKLTGMTNDFGGV